MLNNKNEYIHYIHSQKKPSQKKPSQKKCQRVSTVIVETLHLLRENFSQIHADARNVTTRGMTPVIQSSILNFRS